MSLRSESVYILRNVKSGTLLDLDYQNDEKRVHGWESNGNDNQKWRAIDHGDGWSFQNVQDGYFLAVGSSDLADGLNVTGTESDDTRWYVQQDDWVREHGFDAYRIVVKNSYFSLDLSDHGNQENGTPVTLWGSWEGENQLWRLEEVN